MRGCFAGPRRTLKACFQREKTKKPHRVERVRPSMWRPRQESNLYLALRRRSFYPLNYGGGQVNYRSAYRAPDLRPCIEARSSIDLSGLGLEPAEEQRRCFVQRAIDRRAPALGQCAHRSHSHAKVDGSRIWIPGAGHAHLVLTLDDVSRVLYA